jgi:hypothetical protein
MTTKKFSAKHLVIAGVLLVVVFIIVEIVKAVSAGIKDLESLVTAPFSAAKQVWTSVTGFISGLFGGGAILPRAPPGGRQNELAAGWRVWLDPNSSAVSSCNRHTRHPPQI